MNAESSIVNRKSQIVAALAGFGTKPLAAGATALLESLGYKSERRFPLTPNTAAKFAATFGQGKPLNPEHALLADWQSVDFLFQLTDAEVRAAAGENFELQFEGQGRWNGAEINSFLFLAIALANPQYTRTQLSGITRAVNRLFNMPVIVLFRHCDTLTLAIIPHRLHKRDASKDVLEKVTLIKDIRFANPHRAHIEILFDLSFDELHEKHGFTNFVALQAAWQKTLDSSDLNKRFFLEVANWYFWALHHAEFPKDAPKQNGKDHISVIRLITRLMFCWFVKEKGLIPDILFDERKLPQILTGFAPQSGTGIPVFDKQNRKPQTGMSAPHSVFYKAILQNLFFATLNQEMGKREFRKRNKNPKGRDPHYGITSLYRYKTAIQDADEFLKLMKNIPFLNGGLFECLDKREEGKFIDGFSDYPTNPLTVPDFLFFGPDTEVDLSEEYGDKKFRRVKVRGLIHTFDHYKFTIAENTPIEEEIALDPELSGKVFENLLAAYNPETGATARKQTGSFYTPREIVNYMVDEALIACLKTKLEQTFLSVASKGDTGIPACASQSNSTDKNVCATLEHRLRHLFAYNDEPHKFAPAEVDALIAAIDSLRSLDPAVGSGAFPMGILHKLVFILGKLDPRNEKWKERQRQRAISETTEAFKIGDKEERQRRLEDINEVFEQNASDYGRKLYLIENCIYGVDIQSIAVQIAKMRFFISLVADQKVDDAQPNRGVRPLPNLETKFVAANTLIGINRPGQQLLRNREIEAKEAELRRVRERHFLARSLPAKRKCREQDAKLRAEIADLLKTDGWDTGTARKLASWNPYDQNASAEFFDPEWMFGIMDGFDVVTGNPPYIEFKKLEQKFKTVYEPLYKSATGKYDIYVLFIEFGRRCLSTHGHLAFINPTTFLKKDFGAAIRKIIARDFAIKTILDFADFQVFDGVTNYTGIFVFEKCAPGKYSFPYHKYKRLDGETDAVTFAASLPEQSSGQLKDVITVESSMLASASWDFHTSGISAVLAKMDTGGRPLGELAESIFQGVASGKDEVFYLDQDTISEWAVEKKALLPLLKGQNVKRYVTNWSHYHVLYLYDELSRPIPEKRLKQEFPHAYEYLVEKRDLLRGRPYFDNSTKLWYELWNQRKRGNFERLRIVTPEISDRNNFALTEKFAGNTKTYHIVLTEDDEAHYKFILGLLNSRLLQFYYCSITAPMAGGFFAYKTQFLEKLPIPNADKTQRIAVVTIVDRILAAKRKNPAADVSALEREIDGLVYALYGLTPEEIKIVEGETKL